MFSGLETESGKGFQEILGMSLSFHESSVNLQESPSSRGFLLFAGSSFLGGTSLHLFVIPDGREWLGVVGMPRAWPESGWAVAPSMKLRYVT